MQGDEDDIRRKAYDLWEEEGRPEGKHHEHWHKAQERLREPAPLPDAAHAGTTDVSAQDDAKDFEEEAKAMVPENGAEVLTQERGPDEEGEPASPAQKKVRPRRKTPVP